MQLLYCILYFKYVYYLAKVVAPVNEYLISVASLRFIVNHKVAVRTFCMHKT